MEVSDEFHELAALHPGTPWMGGWMGLRASLDKGVKRKIPSMHLLRIEP
jgi:hypothetical protein